MLIAIWRGQLNDGLEQFLISIYRSSHHRCFLWKDILRNFVKFTGKHLSHSLFLNKVAGLRPATLLKKETVAQVFSCEFYEISKNTFFAEHLWTIASEFYSLFIIKTSLKKHPCALMVDK